MREANVFQRLALAVKNWWRLSKCNFGHDASGPMCVDVEISPGKWYPYYQCRSCGKLLKWKIDGGWWE